jgi:hypothetical protein
MNTATSTVSGAGALSQQRTHTTVIKNNDSRALLTEISTRAEEAVNRFHRVIAGDSEKFYQDHVIAIYIGIYIEVALGPLIGALAIYCYSH